jgi:hypothetical protein
MISHGRTSFTLGVECLTPLGTSIAFVVPVVPFREYSKQGMVLRHHALAAQSGPIPALMLSGVLSTRLQMMQFFATSTRSGFERKI